MNQFSPLQLCFYAYPSLSLSSLQNISFEEVKDKCGGFSDEAKYCTRNNSGSGEGSLYIEIEEATDDVRSMTTRKDNCKSHSAHGVEELAVHRSSV